MLIRCQDLLSIRSHSDGHKRVGRPLEGTINKRELSCGTIAIRIPVSFAVGVVRATPHVERGVPGGPPGDEGEVVGQIVGKVGKDDCVDGEKDGRGGQA